jgi:malate dehydrogenase
MTRLDHNRAAAQLAKKAGRPVGSVTNVTIWGNHSSTQFPDFRHARIDGKPASEVIGDRAWLEGEFISRVQKRGAEVIEARGKSSAASAANAALGHVRTFVDGTPAGDWTSAAVCSDGSYGIQEGFIASFPERVSRGAKWEIVPRLEIDDFARRRIDVAGGACRGARWSRTSSRAGSRSMSP